MNAVEICDLHLHYGNQTLFDGFHFALPKGQWTALLGASGIGKSTLLRAIAGLEQRAITSGEIYVKSRKLAWLAQQDSLFPWLSVVDNVQLEVHLHGNKTAETEQQALQLLAAVGLAEHCHKACYQLSGGQRQRVALARCLMQQADLILMDEPFSALDAVTRLQLHQLAQRLLADKTVLLITHDPQEAIFLADQILVLQSQPARLSPPIYPKSHADPTALSAHLFSLLMGENR